MMRMDSKLINVMTILGNERGAFSGCMSIHYNVREALKSFEFISLLLVVGLGWVGLGCCWVGCWLYLRVYDYTSLILSV